GTSSNPDLGPHWSHYAERNQLFVNDSQGKFRDVSLANAPFCGRAMVSRGLACGDIDGDGAIDLLVTTVAGPARLFRNVAPQKGHWLMVRAIDPKLNRDAHGARIVVKAGDRRWVSGIYPGQSYLCSNDVRAHFGLGSAQVVDSIHILWPEGDEEVFGRQEVDRVVTLRKGEGRPVTK